MHGLREDAAVLFVLTTNRPEALEAALAVVSQEVVPAPERHKQSVRESADLDVGSRRGEATSTVEM